MKYEYFELENDYGHVIRGTVNRPDNYNGEKLSTLIIFHGFTGDSIGRNYLHRNMAKYLCDRGIQVVRFDFSNSGNSDGDFSELTATEEIHDAHLVYDFVKTLDSTDEERICISGHSMGGYILGLVCDSLNPRKAFFLAPATCMKDYAMNLYQEYTKLHPNADRINIDGLMLKKSFVEDLQQYDVLIHTYDYKNPAYIFWGTQDETVPFRWCLEMECGLEFVKIIELPNVGHNFEHYKIREKMYQRIYDEMNEI